MVSNDNVRVTVTLLQSCQEASVFVFDNALIPSKWFSSDPSEKILWDAILEFDLGPSYSPG